MSAASPTLTPASLAAVFKAYDIRGTVPDQLDPPFARALGRAFATVTRAASLVVGHDMRESSAGLADAFAAGALEAGAEVLLLGLASTDQLYFASGRLEMPGAMVTASHNPAGYNGFKLCLASAAPMGRETGLDEVRRLVEASVGSADGDQPAAERPAGGVRRVDLLADYAGHLRALAPVRGRRLRVVVDAGNGMAGHTAPAVLAPLDLDVVPLYFELDGTFPHHDANPLDPSTLVDLQRAVVEERADLGLAFDGDADRCFVVDEQGRTVSPSVLTALIAIRELAKEPGGSVIHNLITSRAVPRLVRAHGGVPVRTRVGHSFIKATMAETGAVFGGEHSGHFYFRDFWRADSGMLAALHTLAALAEQDRPLSALLAELAWGASSGEVNSEVADPAATMRTVEAAYAGRDGVALDRLDGLTVTHADWWFNVRASNTEPLLRLNVEAETQQLMTDVRDDVLALIRDEDR